MTADGKLRITFNKNIKKPNIKIADDPSAKRRLQDADTFMYDIKEVLSISIVDSEDEEYLDKSITDVTLSSVGDRLLKISVAFSKPSDISKELTEPDGLEVKFNMPELFIDAETNVPL